MDRGDAGRATDAGAGILSAAAAPFEDARAGLFGRPALPRAAADVGFSEVSPERARELFPPPGRVRGAIRGARGVRAVGRLLAAALRRAALGRWLEAREAGVTGLILEGGAVRGVSVGGEEIGAGQVVIAAGAWSASFEERLGVRVPIEPPRGQVVRLDLAGMDTVGWPIASAFRGRYMVAWAHGRVVVGGARETSSGFRARSTVTGVTQVLAQAVRVAPGLAGAAPGAGGRRRAPGRRPRLDDRAVATSGGQMGRFETERLATDADLEPPTDLSGAWIDRPGLCSQQLPAGRPRSSQYYGHLE